jgi:nucleoid DNA-binding protein
MKIRETVSQVMADNEKAFKDIPEARAAKIVQMALQAIARQVEETDEGRINVQGFGVFIIKNVEREKEGVTAKQKRVTFRPKSGGADGEGIGAKRAGGGGRKARDDAGGEQADAAGEKPEQAARKAARTGDQAARKVAKQAARKAGRQAGGKQGGRKSDDQ